MVRPIKLIRLSVSVSYVKRMFAWREFINDISDDILASAGSNQKVSSTYRLYKQGLTGESCNHCDSWWERNIFAKSGPSGDPMLIPSICLYNLLLNEKYASSTANWSRVLKSLRLKP